MDLQTGLVCAAVFVLSAGLLLLVSLFGMRSKSYEEALAEQRGISAGLLGTNVHQKQKQVKEKKQKKIGKKVKEKPTHSTTEIKIDEVDSVPEEQPVVTIEQPPVQTQSKLHVEFGSPTILEVPDDIPPNKVAVGAASSSRRSKRDRLLHVKPILVNREPSPVRMVNGVVAEVPTLNHFEEIHPMDEKELLNAHLHPKEQILLKQERAQTSPKSKPGKTKTSQSVKIENTKENQNAKNTKDEIAENNIVENISKSNKDNKIGKKVKEHVVNSKENKENESVDRKENKINDTKNKESKSSDAKNKIKDVTVANPKINKENSINPKVAKENQINTKLNKQTDIKNKDMNGDNMKMNKVGKENVKSNKENQVDNSKVIKETQNVKNKIKQNIIDESIEEMQHIMMSALEKPHEKTVAPVVVQVVAPQPQRESKKKKKSEFNTIQQMSGDDSRVNFSLLVPLIRKAELSRSEVQILIDYLLNKQNEMPQQEWSEGRADPIQKLKKQLAEKERALADEQEAHAGVIARLREVRNELLARVQAQRQIEDTNGALQAERQNLLTRLQHMQEHVNGEKQMILKQMQQLKSELNDERMASRKFQEENKMLKNRQQQLETALTHQNENEKSIKKQVSTMHNEIQEKQTIINSLTMDLHSARGDIEILSENGRKSNEVFEKAMKDRHAIEQHLNSTQLMVNKQTEEMHLVTEALKKSQMEIQTLQVAYAQINQQKEELEKINEQLNNELRIAQVNANGSAEEDKQKEVEMLNLQNELSSARAALQATESDLESYKKKNDDLRQKNWKVMEALNAAEKSNQDLQKNNNESVSKVISEEQKRSCEILQRLFPDVEISNATPQEKFVEEFEKAAKVHLEKTASESQRLLNEAAKKANESTDSLLKEREEYHRKLKELDDKQEKNNANMNDRLAAAEEETKKLQALVTKYNVIIKDTETMLHQLESDTQKAEENWRCQLNVKNQEISDLNARYSQIETKDILELKEKLETERNLNESLLKECETLRQQLEMASQVENSNKDALGALEKLAEEKNRLSHELTAEQIRCRELSDEVDCLRQIQEELKHLKAAANQNHHSNGPAAVDQSEEVKQ